MASASEGNISRTDAAPKVLYLDHVGVLGGAELSLIDMVRGTGNRNHVVLMSQGPLFKAIQDVGVGVTVLQADPLLTQCRRQSGIFSALRAIIPVLSMSRRVAKMARGYHVIWANSQKSFVIGCFASFFSRRPLVWHLRDILSRDHFSFFNRKIAVILANLFATKVITVSYAGMDGFIASGGRRSLVSVLYNGIDAGGFESTDANHHRSAIRKEFSIGDAPLIGAFGRLSNWKGQHVLIQALPALPEAHVLFVGGALFDEDDYAASLHQLARDLGVENRTHFSGFRDDVAKLMSSVDVVVHTSIAPEPFGRVIVEAMLARRPVIATDAGGAREIISRELDGLLVPPSNPSELAAAIKMILTQPERSDGLVKNAYRVAIDRFSLNTFRANVERLTRQVAAGAKARRTKASIIKPDPYPSLPR